MRFRSNTKSPFDPFLKRTPQFTCSERVNRGHHPRPSFPWFSSRSLFSHPSGSHPDPAGGSEHIPHKRDQKTVCACSPPIQSPWFPPRGDPRPLEADDRTDRRETSPEGCRRFQSVHWFCQTLFRIPAASGHQPNSIRMSFASLLLLLWKAKGTFCIRPEPISKNLYMVISPIIYKTD